MNKTDAADGRNRYKIEDIFSDFDDYSHFLKKALTLFQDMQKARPLSLRNYVPEALEVQFVNIKAPRLFFPRYKGVVVIQLPEGKLSPKQKGQQRERALIQFSPVVKINELSLADEFAMRMKVLDSSSPTDQNKKRRNSRE